MNIETIALSKPELRKAMHDLHAYQGDYQAFCESLSTRLQQEAEGKSFFSPESQAYEDARDACYLTLLADPYTILKKTFGRLGGLRGKKVLHVGGNHALFLHILAEQEGIEGTCLDANPSIVQECAPHCAATLEQGNAFGLPQKYAGSFDAVLMHHFLTIDYFRQPESLLDLLLQGRRVLAPGGVLIASMADIPDNVLQLAPFERIVRYTNMNCPEMYSFHKQK